jgi:hypothetical protein
MNKSDPRRIGLLIGREWSWPSAFISEVNNRNDGVFADFVKLGGTFSNESCAYQVIIDRMSHEIPYYRSYLKLAALQGTYVINNPFTWAADDKFFGLNLAACLGMSGPRTVLLPNKRVDAENVPESFRNLVYPMDWQGIINFVGVPAILKDVHTGGRRVARRVHNVDELIQWYDESDTLTVVLQELIDSDNHVHCFVVGEDKAIAIRYSRDQGTYLPDEGFLDEKLEQHLLRDSLRVTRAYGYDVNMVEFVIRDDAPFLINPTNPAPDLDINLLTPHFFGWCVTQIANLAIQRAKHPRVQCQGYEWYQAINRSE